MNRELKFKSTPKRIISLVPSITELLHDLGLEQEVVGVTKFCIHPKEWCKTKAIIGGTKNVHIDKIRALKPDLIIGNKEENTFENISQLTEEFNVLLTDVNSFEDSLTMIAIVSKACNREKEGLRLVEEISNSKASYEPVNFGSVIYLIWKEPYFSVGSKTFIDDMLRIAGFENLETGERYPEITIEKINNLNPKLLLLSTEPYPFDIKHLNSIKKNLKTTIPSLVDGEMFSWYGSRLLKSFEYFNQLKTDLKRND